MSSRYLTLKGLLKFESDSLIFTSSIKFRRVLEAESLNSFFLFFSYKGSYVRAVIKETLRMRCPAIGVIRNIKTPLEIGGFNVDRPALYFSLNLNMCNSPR